MSDYLPPCLDHITQNYGALQRLGFWPVAAQISPQQVEVHIHVFSPSSDAPRVRTFTFHRAYQPLVDQVGKLYYRAMGAVMQDRLIGYADLYHGHVEGLTAALKATHDGIKARGGTILPGVPTPEAIQRMYPTQEGEQA